MLRGIKTLPLRVQRQCENASQVAAWLADHPGVSRVNYPGLASHPQHALAARLLERGAFGAMISFDIRDGDRARVFRFMEALRLVLPATTLGDVYSLALYPAHSSHRALDPDLRRRIGIGDGLVRLSVGIEDPDGHRRRSGAGVGGVGTLERLNVEVRWNVANVPTCERYTLDVPPAWA